MSLSVKEEGNLLFKQKHYAAAAQKFSEAIQLDNRNPVFYGNRAACYFFLRMFPETLRDCHTAIQIDPHYRKAWLRKGDAHDELTQYGDSIESYCTALSLFNGQEDDLDTLRKRIEIVKSKILDPNHVSLEALVTLARLNGIVIPNLNSICTTAQIDDLRRALFRHPKWAFPLPSSNSNPHPSRIQFYLITPDEKTALPRQSTVELRLGRDPTMAYEKEVQRLLGGCSAYTREMILAEDWERCTSQQRWGTGIGRMHAVYEIYRGHGETRPRKKPARMSPSTARRLAWTYPHHEGSLHQG
ncbi:hypothetical protein BKA70DRAFT_1403398 [Coprinopsis sp. MPI-PUGE-AT-0042]|nr:hypothetical protein BKA70DRAFT_1403398 [Coprinopsis sp. MPI-PUGE-AT-0042]